VAEWFRRSATKIKTYDKKDTTEGIWIKCSNCGQVVYRKELAKNHYVCPSCSYHFRIRIDDYLKLLLDGDDYAEIAANIKPEDPLKFVGEKKYSLQITNAQAKTGLNDAVRIFSGPLSGIKTVLCVMDFSFIGGSMGSVVGEKISRGIEHARQNKLPLIIISASGGARMQEGAFSLMQMVKTSAKIAQFSKDGGLFISILTHPTTGGTTASFAMLGDIIIAEPNALIGFAGARVIKQTIGEDLPEGFQSAEFLLEKGFIDNIVHRTELKQTLSRILQRFGYKITVTLPKR